MKRCINKQGDFDCKCRRRFSGNGFDCENINECNKPNVIRHCGRQGKACKDIFGSFKCITCRAGLQLKNGKCNDINECFRSKF